MLHLELFNIYPLTYQPKDRVFSSKSIADRSSMKLTCRRSAVPKPLGEASLLVRRSQIHGTGCYAAKDILCHQVIIEYAGELIGRDEAIERNDPASPRQSSYIMMVSDRLFIDGACHGNAARYINHSCNSNCYVRIRENRAFIVARRNLPSGVELTLDYQFDAEFREPCFCGSRGCRGYM